MVYPLTLGAILSVTTLRGSPGALHSHLAISLALIKREKSEVNSLFHFSPVWG